MAKDPAFLFYPNDYMGGTMGMTFEEKGCYMELLVLQFNKGAFTLDQAKKVLNGSFDRVWPTLKEKFVEADGKFQNERLEKEKSRRQNFIEKQKNVGKKGGRPKKEKSAPDDPLKTQTKPTGFENNNPNHNPDGNPNKTNYENEIGNRTETDLEGKGGLGEQGEPPGEQPEGDGKGENPDSAAGEAVVRAMVQTWKKHNPSYAFIAGQDEKALREIAEFLAGGSTALLDQSAHPALLHTWERWCQYIRGTPKLKNFSLDKINRFYKQEISNNLRDPSHGIHRETPKKPGKDAGAEALLERFKSTLATHN